MFAGNFAPIGWAFCSGQLLPVSEYETLFNLIGTTYGGDGKATFALPNLCSRMPLHAGLNYQQAETGGAEDVTLSSQQIPAHSHPVLASASPGFVTSPKDAYFAAHRDHKAFIHGTPNAPSPAVQTTSAGVSQPHNNMPPYLCVNFIISLFGVFPSQ